MDHILTTMVWTRMVDHWNLLIQIQSPNWRRMCAIQNTNCQPQIRSHVCGWTGTVLWDLPVIETGKPHRNPLHCQLPHHQHLLHPDLSHASGWMAVVMVKKAKHRHNLLPWSLSTLPHKKVKNPTLKEHPHISPQPSSPKPLMASNL